MAVIVNTVANATATGSEMMSATVTDYIANVVPETLTDGSEVFNVELLADGQRIVIGAIDKEGAENIAFAINEGSSWIEVRAKVTT